MAVDVKILRDSIDRRGRHSYRRYRLTTMEVTMARIVLAEWNTHRMFSRNSASSRAIPVARQIRRIMLEPFVPDEFGTNQGGMQAAEPLAGLKHDTAVREWLRGRDEAVIGTLRKMASPSYVEEMLAAHSAGVDSDNLAEVAEMIAQAVQDNDPEVVERDDFLGIHKGLASRPLEAYMWHTVIVTATEWSNFYGLRTDSNAQREIRVPAQTMVAAHRASEPTFVEEGDWHMPMVFDDDLVTINHELSDALKLVTGRTAKVSYMTHDAEKRDIPKDIERHDGLLQNGHMSPFEHAARPMTHAEFQANQWSGNFYGWHQYRKDIVCEDDFAARSNELDWTWR